MATGTYAKTNNTEALYGENSPAVLALQQRLNREFNAGLTEDSKYGPNTLAAYNKYLGGSSKTTGGSGGNTGTGNPPPDSAAGIQSTYNFTISPDVKNQLEAEKNFLDTYNGDANQVIDKNAIYKDTLSRYQANIDAINKVYGDMLNKARIEGQGRLESRKFSLGRSGQIGSGTGEASVNAVQDANTDVEKSIENERLLAVQGILSKVNEAAVKEAADRTAAKKAGAEKLLDFYDKAPTRREARLSPVIKALLEKGIDPSTLSPEELNNITTGLGVSSDELNASYATARTAKEKAKREAEKQTLEQDKLSAEIENLKGKFAFDAAQKALDRAVDEKRISLDWYQAQTARMKVEQDLSNDNPLSDVKPSYSGEVLSLNEDNATELEKLGVTTTALIKVQSLLAQGYSLKQIAQSIDMPQEVYLKLNEFTKVED